MIYKVVKYMDNTSILGIMVCKTKNLFEERGFCKTLQKLGQRYQMQVYIFYPNYVNWQKN